MKHEERNGNSKHVYLTATISLALLASVGGVGAQQSNWESVVGADTLREFMDGLHAERALPNGETARAEYKADGTGVLYEWGVAYPRTWTVEGDNQLCFSSDQETDCVRLEKSTDDDALYRVQSVSTGTYHEFIVTNRKAVGTSEPEKRRTEGGAAKASAAEIAAELANPNTPLGTMNTNFDYITYDGSLPGTNDQSVFKMTFQPSLPYPLGNGKNFFVRPAIPLVFDQPVPTGAGDFETTGVELGDIGYDASVGISFPTNTGSNVLIAGLAGTIPTATDDAVGGDQWLLGPELGAAMVRKWGVLVGLVSHQWDFAGEDAYDTSITGGQYGYIFNVKNGWQILGTPTFSYNHEVDSDNALTFPVAIGVAKTAIINGRPWKLSAQYWNYIEAPEGFGPEHQIRFTIGPVVSLPWKGRG